LASSCTGESGRSRAARRCRPSRSRSRGPLRWLGSLR